MLHFQTVTPKPKENCVPENELCVKLTGKIVLSPVFGSLCRVPSNFYIVALLGETTIEIEGKVPPEATKIKLLGETIYAFTMISHGAKSKRCFSNSFERVIVMHLYISWPS